jgi:hypothetical protein
MRVEAEQRWWPAVRRLPGRTRQFDKTKGATRLTAEGSLGSRSTVLSSLHSGSSSKPIKVRLWTEAAIDASLRATAAVHIRENGNEVPAL